GRGWHEEPNHPDGQRPGLGGDLGVARSAKALIVLLARSLPRRHSDVIRRRRLLGRNRRHAVPVTRDAREDQECVSRNTPCDDQEVVLVETSTSTGPSSRGAFGGGAATIRLR